MFDNLRDQDSSSPFFQEDIPPEEMAEIPAMKPAAPFEASFESEFTADFEGELERPATAARFLGMTDVQRFVIALLLFLTVCLIGASFLVVTGKFFLSFG